MKAKTKAKIEKEAEMLPLLDELPETTEPEKKESIDPDIEHLLIVYRNQTDEEIAKQTANRKNKIGFNKADASILTALAEKYLAQKKLSQEELATVHRLIAKYYKQWS